MPYKDPAREKEYQRQWHLKNWERRKAKHYENQKARRLATAIWFKEYKKSLSCVCGENHPACLDFHHPNDDKEANVSELVCAGVARKTILKEIAKCVVICKNCHAKEHYRD